jgi:hypothetical protein
MKLRKRRARLSVIAATIALALPENAQAQSPEPHTGAARPDLRTIEVVATLGFTESITKGLQPFGVGAGLRVGATLSVPLYIQATVTKHLGSSASGSGQGAEYKSAYSAWSLDLGAAWAWSPVRWLSIRPGIVLSGALVLGSTQVGNATIDASERLFSLGPKLSVVASPTPRFLVGLEGEARAIPKQLFAPIGVVAFIFGARF